MHETADELDLQLVHLLQIAPRISWLAAGDILGLSASAVGARWARLTKEGLAWLAVYPRAVVQVTAFVDVNCEQKHRQDLIHALCRDPLVMSVDEIGSGRDLVLTIMTTSLTGLRRFLLDELGHREGIIRTNARLVTAMHAEGADWRLDALDGEQQRKAAAAGNPVADSIASIDFEAPWVLVDALTRDPRASVASIVTLLSKDFLKLALVHLVLGEP